MNRRFHGIAIALVGLLMAGLALAAEILGLKVLRDCLLGIALPTFVVGFLMHFYRAAFHLLEQARRRKAARWREPKRRIND